MSTAPNAPRRRVYAVHVNPPGYDAATADPFDVEGVTTHLVPVIHADQMVGEREAMKKGLTLDLPQNVTSVIVWSAMRRRGLYTDTYETFRDRDCVGIENAVRPGEDPEGDAVPPTSEPSGSASTSPATSPDSSPTGSTPTSTNI